MCRTWMAPSRPFSLCRSAISFHECGHFEVHTTDTFEAPTPTLTCTPDALISTHHSLLRLHAYNLPPSVHVFVFRRRAESICVAAGARFSAAAAQPDFQRRGGEIGTRRT